MQPDPAIADGAIVSPPSLWLVLLILVVADAGLCGSGMWIFNRWFRRDDTPPVGLVLVLWFLVFVVYLGLTRALWMWTSDASIAESLLGDPAQLAPEQVYVNRNDPGAPSLLTVLLFCVVFWSVPVIYYSNVLFRSIQARGIDPRTWLGISIPHTEIFPDAEDFNEARELALAGDIDGAVRRYKSYAVKREQALLAAAGLLEAAGRFDEAATTLRQLVAIAIDNVPIWTKAQYRLAKILDKHLNKTAEAVTILNQVAVRAPDSEHGRLAMSYLHRIAPESDTLLDMLDAAYEGRVPPPVVDTLRMSASGVSSRETRAPAPGTASIPAPNEADPRAVLALDDDGRTVAPAADGEDSSGPPLEADYPREQQA